MAYTAVAYPYWASFYDAYQRPRHAHYRYQLQLPYISYRTYLTNRMRSISQHITPLVINSLGGGHTHAYRHSRTEAILRKQVRAGLWPVRAWFNEQIN